MFRERWTCCPHCVGCRFAELILIALCLIGTAATAIGVTFCARMRLTANDAALATVLAERNRCRPSTSSPPKSPTVSANNGRLSDEAHHELIRSKAAHRLLAERLARIPQTEFIALVDRDGQLVNTSRNWPAPAASVADRDYFVDAVKNNDRELFVSEIVRNRVSGLRNIIFAKRITGPDGNSWRRGDRNRTALFAAYLRFDHRFETTSTFLLLRSESCPGTSSRSGGSRRRKDAGNKRLVSAGARRRRTISHAWLFRRRARLVAVRPLKNYPLVVNVAVTEVSALAKWHYRAMLIGLGAALTLLCSLVLTYALNNKFAQLAASRSSLAEREARLAEKSHELEQANVRIDRAVNNMGQGLTMFNNKCELLVCNQRYLQLYSFSPDLVKPGTTFRQILEYRVATKTFFGDIDECIDNLTAKMRAGEELVLVMEVNDGRTYCVTNRPTGDGGWVSTHEDITERVRGERELQRARNMLRAVVENIPEMLIVKDAHSGRYVFINRAGEELLGLAKDQLIGRTSHEVFSREQADRMVARDREALQSGRLEIQTNAIHTFDGRTRDVISKRVAIGNKDSEPEYLLNVIEDVTERKRNETRIAHLAHHDPAHRSAEPRGAEPASDRDAGTCVRMRREIRRALRRSRPLQGGQRSLRPCRRRQRIARHLAPHADGGGRHLPGARRWRRIRWRSAPKLRIPPP